MSRTGAGAALKTAAGWSDQVVSALRNHVHYVVNYVFEGRGPRGPMGEVVVRCLWVDTAGRRKAHRPNIHQQRPLKTYH